MIELLNDYLPDWSVLPITAGLVGLLGAVVAFVLHALLVRVLGGVVRRTHGKVDDILLEP